MPVTLPTPGILALPQATPPGFREHYLGIALAVLLVVLVLAAFTYLLVQRNLDWLRRHFQSGVVVRFDGWLSRHTPRLWKHIKRRFTITQWYGLTLTVSTFLVFLLVYLFAFVAESWIGEATLYRVDQAVNQAVRGTLSTGLVGLLQAVTHLGDLVTLVGLGAALAAVFVYRRQWWRLAALLVVVGLGQFVLLSLKWTFARARPEAKLIEAGWYSFPSGHAFTAVVLYGFLILLTWRSTRRDTIRLPVTIALLVLIVLIGASRVLLSVHWASDVLGGFIVGLAWLVAGSVITRALQAYFTARTTSEEI